MKPPPVPHDLSIDDLTEEPNLSSVLYAERFAHIRREHRWGGTYEPSTIDEGMQHQRDLLAALAPDTDDLRGLA